MWNITGMTGQGRSGRWSKKASWRKGKEWGLKGALAKRRRPISMDSLLGSGVGRARWSIVWALIGDGPQCLDLFLEVLGSH